MTKFVTDFGENIFSPVQKMCMLIGYYRMSNSNHDAINALTNMLWDKLKENTGIIKADATTTIQLRKTDLFLAVHQLINSGKIEDTDADL